MREILFRGKKTDTKQWLEGSLITEGPLGEFVRIFLYSLYLTESLALFHYVIPETVGQYTGRKDKNNNLIFEGDIVKDSYGYNYVVKYGRHDLSCCGCCFQSQDSMGFYLCSDSDHALSEENVWDDLKIIGNIHDNPELLF